MTQITADENSFFLVLSVYICVICGYGLIFIENAGISSFNHQ